MTITKKEENKEINDNLFKKDLIYYIRKKSGLKYLKNELTEKRIRERKQQKTEEYNLSKFEIEFLKFTELVASISGDMDLYMNYSNISNYPELVDEILKHYYPEESQLEGKNKVKVIKI